MKPFCNGTQTSLLNLGLFITGALMGACQKPATQSSTPESAPVTTTGASSVESTTSSSDTASVNATVEPVAETTSPAVSTEASGWPAALASNRSRELGSSTFTGCLSKPIADQDNPKRSAAPTKPQVFRVTPLGNGAVVTHDFSHACCLTGTAETTIDGATVTVRERLSGTPCRCMCDSKIQTRLNLPPGDYQVKLVLATNAVESEVGTQPLTIKRLSDR